MNKRQFATKVAHRFNTSIVNAQSMVDNFLWVITESLLEWQEVNLDWFGKFSIASRVEKKWINPRTKESITIAWYSTPRFKASSILKNKIKDKFN